jgi:hypothetical protein
MGGGQGSVALKVFLWGRRLKAMGWGPWRVPHGRRRRRGAWHEVARSADSGPTLAGAGGWHMHARPAPNRVDRVVDKWAWGHSNRRRWFELDLIANSNEFKQVQIFSNFEWPKSTFSCSEKLK